MQKFINKKIIKSKFSLEYYNIKNKNIFKNEESNFNF